MCKKEPPGRFVGLEGGGGLVGDECGCAYSDVDLNRRRGLDKLVVDRVAGKKSLDSLSARDLLRGGIMEVWRSALVVLRFDALRFWNRRFAQWTRSAAIVAYVAAAIVFVVSLVAAITGFVLGSVGGFDVGELWSESGRTVQVVLGVVTVAAVTPMFLGRRRARFSRAVDGPDADLLEISGCETACRALSRQTFRDAAKTLGVLSVVLSFAIGALIASNLAAWRLVLVAIVGLTIGVALVLLRTVAGAARHNVASTLGPSTVWSALLIVLGVGVGGFAAVGILGPEGTPSGVVLESLGWPSAAVLESATIGGVGASLTATCAALGIVFLAVLALPLATSSMSRGTVHRPATTQTVGRRSFGRSPRSVLRRKHALAATRLGSSLWGFVASMSGFAAFAVGGAIGLRYWGYLDGDEAGTIMIIAMLPMFLVTLTSRPLLPVTAVDAEGRMIDQVRLRVPVGILVDSKLTVHFAAMAVTAVAVSFALVLSFNLGYGIAALLVITATEAAAFSTLGGVGTSVLRPDFEWDDVREIGDTAELIVADVVVNWVAFLLVVPLWFLLTVPSPQPQPLYLLSALGMALGALAIAALCRLWLRGRTEDQQWSW